MKTFLAFLTILFMCASAYAEAPKVLTTVYFDTAKADVKAAELTKLEDVAKQVKEEEIAIIIMGGADPRGGRIYNLELGHARAQTVRAVLIDLGVDAESIEAVSLGEEHQIEGGNANNRRVVVLLSEIKVVEVPVEVLKYRKNRISLLGGFGPLGLTKKILGENHFKVNGDYEAVAGLGYSRSLNNRWSIGVQAFTNNSYFLNIGLDF